MPIHEALKLTRSKLLFGQLQKAMREQVPQPILLTLPASGCPVPF
jgi:hypothetical protein